MAEYPGSMKARAERAGVSREAHAKANQTVDGNLGKLARLALLRTGVHGDGKSPLSEAGDKVRKPGNPLYQIG